MKRARLPDAEVEGRPTLAVRDEDREAVADALAELLVVLIEIEECRT